MSTLATVVGSDEQCMADWNSHKAPLDAPLTQFHAKFWGVEEEGGLSNNMEVDDSTADGHEISQRCYVLDIGIRGVEDKIWVRADYIRMFEFAEKFYAESLSNPLSHVLSSQVSRELVSFSDVITLVPLTYQIPCLGKTLWRWYALRVCCAQKKQSFCIRMGLVGCSSKKEFLNNLPRWMLLRAHPWD